MDLPYSSKFHHELALQHRISNKLYVILWKRTLSKLRTYQKLDCESRVLFRNLELFKIFLMNFKKFKT